MLKILNLLILCLVYLSFSSAVFAHIGIHSSQKTSGENIVIVEYDLDHPFSAKMPINFKIRVHQQDGLPIEFEKAVLKYYQDNDVKHTETIFGSKEVGVSTIYIFPKRGDYNLEVEFFNGDQGFSKTSFPFVVQKSNSSSSLDLFSAESAIGLFLGLVLGTVYTRFFRGRLKSYNLLRFLQKKK